MSKAAGARLRFCSGISTVVEKENHVNLSADSRCPKYKADEVVNVG
jgi:hypothetical protein